MIDQPETTAPTLPDGAPPSGCAEYDALPLAVKDQYSYEQWLWLSDGEKGGLVLTETEPEF